MINYRAQLLLEEQVLIKQIETSEACLATVLQIAGNQHTDGNKLVYEDIVMAIHHIQCNLRTELLHVRFTLAQTPQ